MLRPALLLLVAAANALCAPVPQWSVHELSFETGKRYENPYLETGMTTEFRAPSGRVMKVRGFWDGGKVFKVRFTPGEPGRWSFVTQSADPGLNGKRGSFECGPAQPGMHGFLRVDPAAPHHFVRDDGSRFLMLGQTYYEIIATARENGPWKAAVDQLLAHGLNKVRFRLHIKTCNTRDNPVPCRQWWGGDKDHLDLAHFRATDAIVDHLNAKGMIADLMPFDSSADAYGTPEQDTRFLEYVVARYAANPAVIWCLTNEYQRAHREKEYLNQLGAALRVADPFLSNGNRLRPLSIHPLGGMGQGDRFHFADQAWPTHVILQIGRWTPGDPRLYGVMLSNREFGKPVVNDEFGYMGDSALWRGPNGDRGKGADWYTRENHRTSLWAIYMAGTYASTGDKYLYEDGRPYKSSVWHQAAEYQDVASLVTLFTRKGLAYWRMQPTGDVVREGERVYCLAWPGQQYLFYAAAGGPFTVQVAQGKYRARLFDPREGTEKELGVVEGGKPATLQTPTGSDWAVFLTLAQ